MPDDIDRAQAINEQLLGDALAEHQRRMPRGESLTHCEDCGGEIPEARRQAQRGCRRCIDCQAEFEAIHINWRAL